MKGEHDVFDRQERVTGFDQSALDRLTVNVIGAGGLGSEIDMALIRKGVGALNIFDDDVVDITNLPRQAFFRKDLYKPKARCLAKNLSKMATNNSTIRGFPVTFQEALEEGLVPACDIAVCAVDDPETRFFCSKHYYAHVPVVFTAVSREAESGYVFVQTPGEACFGCLARDEHGRPRRPCTGSTIDINKAMGAIVSYAVDTLCMKRVRKWNYKRVDLSGFLGDLSVWIERNPGCRFCGN